MAGKTVRNLFIAAETKKTLAEIKAVRRGLRKAPVRYLGRQGNGSADYVGNFGAMILNRSIDNFDDALFLLEAGRFPSACAIARGLIETVAFGSFTISAVRDELKANGGSAANDLVIKHTNSSLFKQNEQRAVKKGVFQLDDYQFTEAAKARMLAEAASTVRISRALDYLFKGERDRTGEKESKVEFVYDALCEWTHPSQMSLLTYYAEGGEAIPTSAGPIPVKQAAKFQCLMGLEIIQLSPVLQDEFESLSREVLAAGGQL